MANDILKARLAIRLAEASGATPQGEGYWETLADVAAGEMGRIITQTRLPLPTEPLLALVKQREGFSGPVAQAATITELAGLVDTVLERRGYGEIWMLEVRRIVSVP